MNAFFSKHIFSFYQLREISNSHKYLMPFDVKSQLDSHRGPTRAQTDTDLTHSLLSLLIYFLISDTFPISPGSTNERL